MIPDSGGRGDAPANAWAQQRDIIASSSRTILPSIAAVVVDGGEQVFSGSFLRVRGLAFVLTARHCIEDMRDRQTIRIHSTTAAEPVGAAGVRGYFWATSPKDPDTSAAPPRLDVGLILLHDAAARMLRPRWLTLDRLSSQGARGGSLALLGGFPCELAEVTFENGRPSTLTLDHMLYFGEVSEREPGDLRSPAEPHLDLFIEYHATDIRDLASPTSPDTIQPHGLSGCPVFLIPRLDPDTIWTPELLQVAGIQSSFLPDRHLLRATKAEFARRAVQDVCAEIIANAEAHHAHGRFSIEPRPMPDAQL